MAKQAKKQKRREKTKGQVNDTNFLDSAVASTRAFTKTRLIEGGLFYLFSLLVIVISFLGQKEKGPRGIGICA